MHEIRMSYQQLREINFSMQLIGKIFNTPMKGKTTLKMKKIFDCLINQSKIIQEEAAADLEAKFAKKDENGNVIRPEKDPFGFEVDEAKAEEFARAREEFNKKEFVLHRAKLTLDELADIKLSVTEMTILEPLLDTTEGAQPTPLHVA